MKAPIKARAPPMIHAPSAMAGVGTSRATTAGFLNMPAPMMPPMTMRVASKGPSLWARPFSAGAGCEGSVLMPESSARGRELQAQRQTVVCPTNDGDFQSRARLKPFQLGFANCVFVHHDWNGTVQKD